MVMSRITNVKDKQLWVVGALSKCRFGPHENRCFQAHSRFGSLEYDGSPVSLEEMERSIAEGVVERFNAERRFTAPSPGCPLGREQAPGR